MSWTAVLGVSVACYLLKLAGMLVPPARLAGRAWASALGERLPAALLAALVVTGAVATGRHLVVDARLAGLGVAVVLLVVRAPLVTVVVGAAVATALLRWWT